MGWLSKYITEPVSTRLFIFIVTVIWFELVIGLLATSYTFFFKFGRATEVLPLLIFGVYVGCVAATLFHSVRSARARFHGAHHNATVNWLTLGMTTVDTLVIFGVIYGYNRIKTENRHEGVGLGWLAVGFFVIIFFMVKMVLLMYIIQRKEYTTLEETEAEKEELAP